MAGADGAEVEQLLPVGDKMPVDDHLTGLAPDEVAVGNPTIIEGDFVMGEFVVVFVALDANEGQGQKNGAGVEEFERGRIGSFCRKPTP